MSILKKIIKRRSIREYTSKKIPKKVISEILKAGIWGPSVLGIQTWKFEVISNKEIIEKICQSLTRRCKKSSIGVRILLKAAVENMLSSQVTIAVYNIKAITALSKRMDRQYLKFAKMAEIASSAAAIQNMIIVADQLGLGTCWHDIPLICEKSINKILQTNFELIAILTLGYPAEKGRRTPRRKTTKFIRHII